MKFLTALAALTLIAAPAQATPEAHQLPLHDKVVASSYCANRAVGMSAPASYKQAVKDVLPLYGDEMRAAANSNPQMAMYTADLALWYGCNSGIVEALGTDK